MLVVEGGDATDGGTLRPEVSSSAALLLSQGAGELLHQGWQCGKCGNAVIL